MVTVGSVIFVVGKGGVGRTTVARGYALAASVAGQRTAYVELDVAGRKQSRVSNRTPDESTSTLTCLRLDGLAAIEAVATPLFGSQRIARTMLGNFAIQRLLDVVPAIREYALLASALELAKQYQCVVIDMPATGHGAAWLGVAGRLASLVPAGRTRDQAMQVQAALRDPKQTQIVAVALTEEIVLTETRELRAALDKELNRDIDHLVFNRVRTVPVGAKAAANQLADSDSLVATQVRHLLSWLEQRERERKQGSKEAGNVGVTWIDEEPNAPSALVIATALEPGRVALASHRLAAQ
jgi:arsenite/tail-anchored protein-transporting ATPase